MVKVLAPAKINFTLDITGKLENGYCRYGYAVGKSMRCCYS